MRPAFSRLLTSRFLGVDALILSDAGGSPASSMRVFARIQGWNPVGPSPRAPVVTFLRELSTYLTILIELGLPRRNGMGYGCSHDWVPVRPGCRPPSVYEESVPAASTSSRERRLPLSSCWRDSLPPFVATYTIASGQGRLAIRELSSGGTFQCHGLRTNRWSGGPVGWPEVAKEVKKSYQII